MAGSTFAEISQWGDAVPAGVGEMREDFSTLEQMGTAIQEAISSKVTALAQGQGALDGRPIDESVLSVLRQVEDLGQSLSTLAAQAAQVFEDEYGEDIRRALAAERPTEDWLRQGA